MHSRTALADKFTGTLLGVGLGDALGAPFEGMPEVAAAAMRRLLEAEGDLRYTDDTHMTMGLAESLLERGRFDGAHLTAVWARKYREQPWRGYASGPGEVFALVESGVPWYEAGGQLYGGQGSWGNGAAMRIAPVALLSVEDTSEVSHMARQTAVITHAHPLGIEGAVFQAVALVLLLQQPIGAPLDVPRFLEDIHARVGEYTYRQQLEAMTDFLPGGRWEHEDVTRVMGNGVAAHRSVVTALYCFLRHQDDFASVIEQAIMLGGDTDTIASMAGALAGAFLGATAIPEAWTARLEDADQLRDQANGLFGLARSRMVFSPSE